MKATQQECLSTTDKHFMCIFASSPDSPCCCQKLFKISCTSPYWHTEATERLVDFHGLQESHMAHMISPVSPLVKIWKRATVGLGIP